MLERRRHQRVVLREKVFASLPGEDAVRVADLSLGGATLEHEGRLIPGDTHVLDLRLGEMEIRLGGRIVWSRPVAAVAPPSARPHGSRRSGVHFPGLPRAAERVLQTYLAAQEA